MLVFAWCEYACFPIIVTQFNGYSNKLSRIKPTIKNLTWKLFEDAL